jgi:hypothetical protein
MFKTRTKCLLRKHSSKAFLHLNYSICSRQCTIAFEDSVIDLDFRYKMSSSKQTDLLRDFAAGVYLSEAQNPIPPPLHTVYVYTVYLFTQERGGGRIEPERRSDGQQFTKLYRHTNLTDCISSL